MALHGEDAVDDDTLKRLFMLYPTQFERDTTNAVLSDATSTDLKQECLLGVYEHFGMTCCPAKNKEELHQHIVLIWQELSLCISLCSFYYG